jgi:uncharacterized protein
MLRGLLQRAAGAGDALLATVAPGSDAAAQARSLSRRAHRPWPLPDGPWLQGQTWSDLLFAHWALPVEALRDAVPAELPIDTFDGQAWIGVTPFEVRGLRVSGMPPPPIVSRFPETNVRTYTTLDGRPGVHFLSLDAASRLAAAAARLTYRLPYHVADMRIARDGDAIAYRTSRKGEDAELAITYRPTGPAFVAEAGTLDHFLTERYCLYTVDGGRVLRADIHHPPWPLQAADADIVRNTMTAPRGIHLPPEPPLLHFAARQDVLIWPPVTVRNVSE